MADHAPGPWKQDVNIAWLEGGIYGENGEKLFDCGGQRAALIQDAKGSPVAFVYLDEEDDEAEATLRLILAAPSLAKILNDYHTAAELLNRAQTMLLELDL